jgi:hypothetical protein
MPYTKHSPVEKSVKGMKWNVGVEVWIISSTSPHIHALSLSLSLSDLLVLCVRAHAREREMSCMLLV